MPFRLILVCGWILLLGTIYPAFPAELFQPESADPFYEPWRWRYFSELEGQNAIQITQTVDGILWFSIDAGLMSYDGRQWKKYTPAETGFDLPILSICSGKDGSLYVGTFRGLYRFNQNHWETVAPDLDAVPFVFNGITESKTGGIWAATSMGILYIAPQKITLYTSEVLISLLKPILPSIEYSPIPIPISHPEILPPIEKMKEEEWISTLDAVIQYDGTYQVWFVAAVKPGGRCDQAGLRSGDIFYSMEPPIAPNKNLHLDVTRGEDTIPIDIPADASAQSEEFNQMKIHSVFEGIQGDLWIGLWNGYVLHASPQSSKTAWDWKGYSALDGMDQGENPLFCQTQDLKVWMVTNHNLHGISLFDGNKWTPVPSSNKIQTSVIRTRDNEIWIGQIGNLLVNKNGKWFDYPASKTDLPIPTTRIMLHEAIDSSIWMLGLGQSVVRYDRSSTRWKTYPHLLFQAESPDHSFWFLHQNRNIIRQHGEDWTQFTPADGVIDFPNHLFVTRDGTVWISGSHAGAAAIAYFDGNRWLSKTFPNFAKSLDHRAAAEAPDGTLWFASKEVTNEKVGGYLKFTPGSPNPIEGEAVYFHPPLVADSCYGIALQEKSVWCAGFYGVYFYDGNRWSKPAQFLNTPIDTVFTDRSNTVWLGTRNKGVFTQISGDWKQYSMKNGLPSNEIKKIMQDNFNRIWIETPKGVSVFDGQRWLKNSNPIFKSVKYRNHLQNQTRDNAYWINQVDDSWYETVTNEEKSSVACIRYQPDTHAPQTSFTLYSKEVSDPGYTVIRWQGTDYENDTPQENLFYSYQLDQQPWSPFSRKTEIMFPSLPDGLHHFEVRAQDQDFNVESKPTSITFRVIPPTWKQPWFLLLLSMLSCGILIQTIRVLRRDRHLANINKSLEERILERTNHIKEREEWLQTIFQEVSDAILIHDEAGKILDCNQMACAMTGYTYHQLTQMSVQQIEAPEFAQQYEDRLQQQKKSRQMPLIGHYLRHDGSKITVEIHSAYRQLQGVPVVLSIVTDITKKVSEENERKHLEEQLRQSQKMEAVGRLAGGIAHDFNNLLTGILGYSEIAQFQTDNNNPAQESLKEIQKAAKRATNLTAQLLAFSRKQVLEPKIVSLNNIIASMISMLRPLIGEDIELLIRPHAQYDWIKADPGQIEQVIMNLAINARDAMPKGGLLSISTSNLNLEKNSLRLHEEIIPGEYIQLSIRDTGTGMSPEIQSQVFEPFFTTKGKGKGTGLGLSTVYGIVKQSGGYIDLNSEIENGTEFSLYFPRTSEKPSPKQESSELPTPTSGSETILLVEDEEMIRNLITDYLEKSGYTVFQASSGKEALTLFTEHKDHIHLIVTDVIMPEMSGSELIDQIQTFAPHTKVLFISGYTGDRLVRHGVIEKGINFMAKPFTPLKFLQKIRTILDTETTT